MQLDLWLFVPACFALNMAPGPNNLMALHNASAQGVRAACVAGLGRQVAFILMMGLAAVGLASVLYASVWVFTAIKLAGGGYLLYLAWQLWHTQPASPDSTPAANTTAHHSVGVLARREFLMAIGNPKAILIFTAFLPQFVNIQQPIAPQFAVLGALFLALECAAIAMYALAGRYAAAFMQSPTSRKRFNRISASLLGAAGVGLLLTKAEANA
jgi:threonine/homoserine/homoserine lactone efflux protein